MENIHYTFVTFTMTFPKLTSSRNFVTSYTLSWITVQTDLLAPLPSLCLETSSREYFCKAAILTKFGEFSRLTGAFRLSKNKLIRNLLSFRACWWHKKLQFWRFEFAQCNIGGQEFVRPTEQLNHQWFFTHYIDKSMLC